MNNRPVLPIEKGTDQDNPFLMFPIELHHTFFGSFNRQEMIRMGRVCRQMFWATKNFRFLDRIRFADLDYSKCKDRHSFLIEPQEVEGKLKK